MRVVFYLIVFFFVSCTKELENQVEELKQANIILLEQLNNLIADMNAYEAQITICNPIVTLFVK